MTESCFTVLIVAAGLTSLVCMAGGFWVLCYTVARYLRQAEAPESIDLGTGFSLKERSFWLRIQGSKKCAGDFWLTARIFLRRSLKLPAFVKDITTMGR